jgi:hypothetical protein
MCANVSEEYIASIFIVETVSVFVCPYVCPITETAELMVIHSDIGRILILVSLVEVCLYLQLKNVEAYQSVCRIAVIINWKHISVSKPFRCCHADIP